MVKKILGYYLFIGSVVFFILALWKINFLYVLSSFFVFLVFLAIILFFIYSGLSAALKTGNKSYTYIQISFLIQSISFSIFGIEFKNYFGPFLGIGFTDTPEFRFLFSFKLFWYNFLNGYKGESDEIMIVFNLVPLVFLFLLSLEYSNLQKKEFNSSE